MSVAATNRSSIDVTCHEVCVHCCRIFRIAGEFIRHVKESHKSETGRKATYMQETHDEFNTMSTAS